MWSTRLIVAAVATLVVVAAIDAFRSGTSGTTSPRPGSTSPAISVESTSAAKIMPECGRADVTVRIAIRRPAASQIGSSDYEATGRQRVATIVVRNVSDHPCRTIWGLHLTIKDRVGRTIGEWLAASWFTRPYPPGFEKTFSLPAVYTCKHPGPFVALATVGIFSVRRAGLNRREITC
jgi:hypothetical protein